MLPKRMFKLDERLAACASLVRQGAVAADIGTDHAYLPIYLVKNGIAEKAIAADINVGPLQRAAMNVKKYRMEDKISTRISDGLEVIFPHEADDIIIAGMGGELIARIIDAAPWLRDSSKHLILQPMTAAEELRDYLKANGFYVSDEKSAIAVGKPYSAMLAYYDQEYKNDSELFRYVGLVDSSDDAGKAYIERVIRFYTNRLEGLKKSGKSEEAAEYDILVGKLKERLGEL